MKGNQTMRNQMFAGWHSVMMIVVLVGVLLLGACTTNEKLRALEAVIASLEIVLPSLEIGDPTHAEIYAQIRVAIRPLPLALQQTTVELASLDSDAVKATKIAGYFEPCIVALSGLPPSAQAIVAGVMGAINVFLQSIQPPLGAGKLQVAPGAGKALFIPHKDAARINGLANRIGALTH